MFFVFLVVVVVAGALYATLGVVAEYERAVVFRLGRVVGARGPGLVVIVRGIDEVRRVSLRLVALDLPPQDLITSDNVAVKVKGVVYVRVVDPVKAVVNVEDYRSALAHVAHATLRAVIGQVSLDQLLHSEDAVSSPLKQLIDERTESWGVEVGMVEIEDIELPEPTRRAMAPRTSALPPPVGGVSALPPPVGGVSALPPPVGGVSALPPPVTD